MVRGFNKDDVLGTTLGSLSPALSGPSIQLLLDVISMARYRYQWQPMSDGDWDDIDALLAETEGDLMVNPFVGSIIAMATENLPDNMLWCDGSVLDRTDYQELYLALSETYQTSETTFTLPDLQGVFLRGDDADGDNVGTTGGSDTHELSTNEMPSHYHTYGQPTLNIDVESVGIPDPTGVGLPMVPTATSSTGGGNAHNNLPTYHTIRYAIIAR